MARARARANLLDTSLSPLSGYTYQATLGYLRLAGSPPSGIVTEYLRNALGQVIQAAKAMVVSPTVSAPIVTYTYIYDPAHRLQSVTDSRGLKRLTYSYSPGGQRTSVRDSDGGTTSYGYDPVGRLTGIWAPNGPALSMSNGDSVTLGYDAGGRLTEKFFPNGASTRYSYNADSTLAQVITLLGSSILTQHDYTYDGVGNRQSHIENIGGAVTAYAYTYDPLNRLLQATGTSTETYTYDPLSNRLSKTSGGATTTYVYDAANQVTKACLNDSLCLNPTTTFSCDFSGNLSTRVDGSLVTSYAYDPESPRLRRREPPHLLGLPNRFPQSTPE